jgi:hypothetical protein
MSPAGVRLLAALGLSSASALAAGCALCTNPEQLLTAEVPTDWKPLKTPVSAGGLSVSVPGAAIQLRAETFSSRNLSVADQFKAFEDGFNAQAAGRSTVKLKVSTASTHGGVPGQERLYDAPLAGQVLKIRLWIGMRDNTVYNLFYAQAKVYAAQQPAFQQVLNSFKAR